MGTQDVGSDQRRTIAGWVHYLNDPDGWFTLDEFVAKCLLDMRDNIVLGRIATEHLDGMLGTLDTVLDQRDPLYRHFAERRTRPPAEVSGPKASGLTELVGGQHG